jgi:2-keto-4-pentenoate hydratase
LSEPETARVKAGLEAQFRALAAKLAEGDELIGWKIGINAEPVQEHFGLSRPVLGHLTRASLIEPGTTHSVEPRTAAGARVGVEPEVAIHLGEAGAIESLGAAIEIVELDPALTELEPILAANVFHRGVVLGLPAEGVGPADLATIAVRVHKNGSVVERARYADAGEDPLDVVRLIAERLALVGAELDAGQVIIAGSLTPIAFVEPGDRIEIDLGPVGSLSLALD